MSIMDNISEDVNENNLLTIVGESETPSQSLNPSQTESTSKPDEHFTKNILEAFKCMSVYSKPKSTDDLEEFQYAKVRELVGSDLTEEEFNKLAYLCSPDHLKVGTEIKISTKYPTQEHEKSKL